MKIGISSKAYISSWEDPSAGLQKAKDHGYDCLDADIFLDTEQPWFYESEDEFRHRMDKIRRCAQAAGIEFSQTHGPWRFPPKDFEESDRRERFLKMTRAIEGTALLYGKVMVIHPVMPFGFDKNPDEDAFYAINYEFFSRLTEIAERAGVVIGFENMPMRRLPISRPADTLAFVKRIASPYFKMCLDTGHAAVFSLPMGDVVRGIGKDALAVLHVHDNDGEHDLHRLPFAAGGTVDWADFSRSLYDIGFDGVLSLETQADIDGLSDGEAEKKQREVVKIARKLAALPKN